ncbi:hypothetical protein [Roseobacter sp.]|uniref:hypothetical protein n=1 Tax=Roseobacter sp. TaxID=1907202 RepID=UPI00296638CD|nr:hypothetical protein [Roseobacter sp.]MDW3181783.1 hypothetical protein [Roseobacter sp.]
MFWKRKHVPPQADEISEKIAVEVRRSAGQANEVVSSLEGVRQALLKNTLDRKAGGDG